MAKVVKRLSMVVALLLCAVGVTACSSPFGKVEYKAKTSFFYSNDKGRTYGDSTKEYAVGETVYMKVMFEVVSNKNKSSQIKAVLTIPNIESVDAKYMDGQDIDPSSDPIKNVTTYEFTTIASKKSTPTECVIQFKPNSVGSIRMTLVYDDNVDDLYNLQNTLEFVEPEPTQED